MLADVQRATLAGDTPDAHPPRAAAAAQVVLLDLAERGVLHAVHQRLAQAADQAGQQPVRAIRVGQHLAIGEKGLARTVGRTECLLQCVDLTTDCPLLATTAPYLPSRTRLFLGVRSSTRPRLGRANMRPR